MIHLLNQRFDILTPERSVPSSPTLSPAVVTPTLVTTKPSIDLSELTKLLLSNNKPTRPDLNKKRPNLSHRSASTPSQFVFKRPEYDQAYHQTHFHKHQKSKTATESTWSDLRRFIVNSYPYSQPVSPTQSVGSIDNQSIKSNVSFGNQFRQNIGDRYGRWGKFIGKGAGGSVRLIRRSSDQKTFAVKQFQKKLPMESEKQYIKKITAEFCIGSTLHHQNIIETLDIIQEENNYYQIMEYAPNDLFHVVMSGMMSREEIACCWRQLLNGLDYLQSMGIAHRDIKLDNLVLDHLGILKIIDFGCSTVYKYPFEDNITLTKGVFGSDPYIAPEQYSQSLYDPRLSDLWSCAIVFICMSIRRFPWRIARLNDPAFRAFAANHHQQKLKLLKMLPRQSRPIISALLELDPKSRLDLKTVLDDPWVKSIDVCQLQEPGHCHVHHVTSISEHSGRDNLVVLTQEPPGVIAGKEKRKK